MVFSRENEKLAIVVLNFNFPNYQVFLDNAINKNILSRFNFEEKQIPVNINGPITPDILEQIKFLAPYQAVSPEGFTVIFNPQESKLILEKSNFDKDNDFENLKNILGINGFIGSKISDISAIGFNFSAESNLGQSKLQLLTERVMEVEVFSKNLTFEFVLPVQHDDHVSTYKIRKIKGGDDTGADRWYEVSVNCHFDITALGLTDRISRVDEIFNGTCYDNFVKTSNEFLELNDGSR